MNHISLKYWGVSLLGLSSLVQAAERPNIIIILADDMGYSDLGCYGGEVETPNLDRLAENGLRYRQFYNAARSCPTRASLLTGLYPHQAGMGWMAAADLQRPAYQGYLNDKCVTIAEVLSGSGYRTYMSGKWHVSSDRKNNGGIKDIWPNQRGFDRFYGIVGGAANYFKMIYNNDNERYPSPDDGSFYFTHAISDSAVAFIDHHNYQDPLFLYLAYTSPHWPLHALQEDIDKYVDRYKKGWDRLREERFQRQKAMGLFGSGVVMSPRDEAVPAWDELSETQQHEFVMRMAIYAAQVDAMDQGIGKVVQQLESEGQLDNTIIMFLSDNGACAEFISSGKRKDVDGKEDTYESYRINWANLSSTPYKEYKHHTNEGGIATPLVVHYPKGIKKKLNNGFVDEYGHLIDIMATCVDLGKARYPQKYDGKDITPMQGVSLVPNFSGKRTNRKLTFWEHEANIAVRDGKWKLVTKTLEGDPFDESGIHLYDMSVDPTEMNDLAGQYPGKKEELYGKWKNWAEEIGVFPLDTRTYGERQRAYKRDCINGEFDDHFGDWEITNRPDAKADFTIDTIHTISGTKTARIDIREQGERPASASLKWVFNAGNKLKASVSFKAMAKNETDVYFRLEKVQDVTVKPIDQKVTIGTGISDYEFNHVFLPGNGNYQLVFYVGNSDGTIWIDDVKLLVEN
ncbi:MAG: arylsulfatase [Bacteroidales bacterium]|jgi:arylsulfatase|nr:arylsulfatase [Bacteroidales bacterium]